MSRHIYWSPIESRFGNFAAWVDDAGRLVRFEFSARKGARDYPDASKDKAALGDIQQQIAEYDAGTRKTFDVVRAARGSEFQHRVWDALWDIPYGETTSYGAVAKQLGLTNGARAVGLANGQNPIALIVPCHRVIGADGSLTGFGGGLPLKKALLAHEAAHTVREGDLFAGQS
jgi:methylated-DNA-[protein]-cysteine S-methyltransferase